MELISAFTVGTEAISLGAELVKLVKTLRAQTDKSPDLTEMLGRLQIEAVRLSRDFENRLRVTADSLSAAGIDVELTFEQQLNTLQWYNFVSRARLKSFREECSAIRLQLTTFIDDVTAVLICKGKVQDGKVAFLEAFTTKRELDALLASRIPIKDILSEMLRVAGQISAELQVV
jgi:hypothetical protein